VVVKEVRGLGSRIVATLGEPGARELLDVLTRPDVDRAALIGRLLQRDATTWLAELLMDIESDANDITRCRSSRRCGSSPRAVWLSPRLRLADC
jgi:hypothetical protein